MYRTLIRKFAVLLIAFISTIGADAFAQLQLGGNSYSRASAPHLRMPVTLSTGFFMKVGGVAFSAIAEGEGNLIVTSLSYDAKAPDGSRLVVGTSDGQTKKSVRADLYDWQLVPIARFARDENGSAVTLFGNLDDSAEQEKLTFLGNRIINYHPAMDNTLLGLRLFQADILIIQPEAADLFREGGSILFGAGESGHDLKENQKRFGAVMGWTMYESMQGNEFDSYVVGDIGQKVTFSISNGRLVFKGEPYWHAWRSAGIADLASTESTEENDNVVAMPDYSDKLTRKIQENQGVNPLVYASVRNTMHYRALFKHFQQKNRAAYVAFVNTLKSVDVRPAVITPTIQHSGAIADATGQ